MRYSPNMINYQEDGIAFSLAEANKKISEARRATPEGLRDCYRSSVIFDKKALRYNWAWVLKG